MNETTESLQALRLRADAHAWFATNWDPDRPLGDWWDLFARSGWAFPTWPSGWFGRDVPRQFAYLVEDERRRAEAAAPPMTLGAKVIAPLLLDHGSDDQKERFLLDTIAGRAVWCELFSEPGAGSDLAGLSTRAVLDGDEWTVNGQKVWSSGAPIARWGLLVARTDPDVPKHQGLTCFVVDMQQPGVDARPLRAMTGDYKFSEVFFTDAVIPSRDVLGDVGRGWEMTKATLALERKIMGGMGDNHKQPDLARPAGAVAGIEQAGQQRGAMVTGVGAMALVRSLLDRFGGRQDPVIRQRVAHLHSLAEVVRYTGLRSRAAVAHGDRPGPEASTVKLLTGRVTVALRQLALEIEGAHGMLSGEAAPLAGVAQRLFLASPSMSIMAGTDEVMRNIVGEQVLGLAAEPVVDKDLSWRQMRRPTAERTGSRPASG